MTRNLYILSLGLTLGCNGISANSSSQQGMLFLKKEYKKNAMKLNYNSSEKIDKYVISQYYTYSDEQTFINYIDDQAVRELNSNGSGEAVTFFFTENKPAVLDGLCKRGLQIPHTKIKRLDGEKDTLFNTLLKADKGEGLVTRTGALNFLLENKKFNSVKKDDNSHEEYAKCIRQIINKCKEGYIDNNKRVELDNTVVLLLQIVGKKGEKYCYDDSYANIFVDLVGQDMPKSAEYMLAALYDTLSLGKVMYANVKRVLSQPENMDLAIYGFTVIPDNGSKISILEKLCDNITHTYNPEAYKGKLVDLLKKTAGLEKFISQQTVKKLLLDKLHIGS